MGSGLRVCGTVYSSGTYVASLLLVLVKLVKLSGSNVTSLIMVLLELVLLV